MRLDKPPMGCGMREDAADGLYQDYFSSRNVTPAMYEDSTLPHYLSSRLPRDKAARILDFGCGFGQTMRAIATLGYTNVMGVDIEPEALAYCKGIGLDVIDGTLATALAGLEGGLDFI